MRLLMARWILPFSCAVLATVTACDFGIGLIQESNAELDCRQGGYGLGSTAYDDCVETLSASAMGVAARETEPVTLGDVQIEPSAADSGVAKPEPANLSESAELSAQVTTIIPEVSEHAIHLSSVRNQIDTKTEWKRLQKRFPNLLENWELLVRSVELEERGIYYRVLAGPFADYAKAQDVCAMFKSRDQYCLAMHLRGDQSAIPSGSG